MDYSFPGQVVGIEGHNPSGHCLVASKLVDSIPPTSVADDKDLNPAKKLAIDKSQPIDITSKKIELSMVASKQCNFVQIPTAIGSLEKLQTLDLSNNDFSGEIPNSLGGLKNLNYL
ncbi:LRR receptor-like serine/threonine-protein kinase GSO1 [Arachis ipaensis]|uniref:LRR receptor-like serine/threonine-protein kinase GSO1 n=1 Tax=Arachis ipaensis TaxID=130454 RepID=UPI000A2B6506|nr:LRR receptor-like serine/threonine-protein kinase GSO1 [Arachis ipaensis]